MNNVELHIVNEVVNMVVHDCCYYAVHGRQTDFVSDIMSNDVIDKVSIYCSVA